MINKNFKGTLAWSRYSSNIYWQNVEWKKGEEEMCWNILFISGFGFFSPLKKWIDLKGPW